jgi:hypothetical protein
MYAAWKSPPWPKLGHGAGFVQDYFAQLCPRVALNQARFLTDSKPATAGAGGPGTASKHATAGARGKFAHSESDNPGGIRGDNCKVGS